MRGSNKDDDDDYSSPLPAQSSSRLRGPRRSDGPASHERAVPLATLDGDFQGRFRPDKLAVTLTTIQGQGQSEPDSRHNRNHHHPWSGSQNTSEERLNAERPAVPAGSSLEGEGDMGMGIHRRFEMTQTTSSGRDSNSP